MIYDNEIKITFRNSKIANEALVIMKERLSKGFACDTNYDNSPSNRLLNDLYIDGRNMVISRENGYYLPNDMEIVMLELLKTLAKTLNKTFTCDFKSSLFSTFTETSVSEPQAIKVEEKSVAVSKINNFLFMFFTSFN